MRRWIVGAVIALSAVTATAQPDKDWWACQFTDKAGLRAQGNETWKQMKYELGPPFVLISDGNGGLTGESADMVVGGPNLNSYCKTGGFNNTTVTCATGLGHILFFYPDFNNGAVSSMFDAAMISGDVWVAPFTCTKGS